MGKREEDLLKATKKLRKEFEEVMDKNFDTPKGLKVIHELAKDMNKYIKGEINHGALAEAFDLYKLLLDTYGLFERSGSSDSLTDNETFTFNARPDEISLVVRANFSNNTSQNITNDDGLVYSIIDGETDVIEEKDNSPGVYIVNGSGSAKIKMDYRGETFNAVLSIP